MATLKILRHDATCSSVSPKASPDVSPNCCLRSLDYFFLTMQYPDHTVTFLFWQLKKIRYLFPVFLLAH